MTARKPAIPKADDLYAEAKDLFDDNEKLYDLWDRLDRLYDQEEPRQTDESVQLVKMPYATNTVDLIVDLASQTGV